jgi:hypothetical protein
MRSEWKTMQGNKISFQELRDGLAGDKEYSQGCEELLEKYLSLHTLTEHDFSGPVFELECLDKLLRIWLGYEGLTSYLPGSNEPLLISDSGDIQPAMFLSEVTFQAIKIDELEIDFLRFTNFLFFQDLPLPTPDVEDKTFWLYGHPSSTEKNKIGEEPDDNWDENLTKLTWDIATLEERSYTDDREEDKRQRAKLRRKKKQNELHMLYCKKGEPVIGSKEYNFLWDELNRFDKINTELDELEQAVPDEWRLKRKRLLKQEIKAIEGWCKHERESPTTDEKDIIEDYPSRLAEYRSKLANHRELGKKILQEYIEQILIDNPKGISNKNIWNQLEKYDSKKECIIDKIDKIHTTSDKETAEVILTHYKNGTLYKPIGFRSFENRVTKAKKAIGKFI